MGAGVDSGTENVSRMMETVPEAMDRKESQLAEEPQMPNVSSLMDSQKSESVNPKVPSKDPHSTTTLHMEKQHTNSATLPSVEESSVDQISTALSDATLAEKSDSEIQSKNSNSCTENSDSKTISSGDNGSGVSLRSEGESVLPSMGVLPGAEGSADQGAHAKRPQQPSQLPGDAGASGSGAQSPETQAVDPSDVVHKIKKIKWQDIEVPIITQNNNGPCPLIAIVNVMILKVSY